MCSGEKAANIGVFANKTWLYNIILFVQFSYYPLHDLPVHYCATLDPRNVIKSSIPFVFCKTSLNVDEKLCSTCSFTSIDLQVYEFYNMHKITPIAFSKIPQNSRRPEFHPYLNLTTHSSIENYWNGFFLPPLADQSNTSVSTHYTQ